jgi:hypothetical protein
MDFSGFRVGDLGYPLPPYDRSLGIKTLAWFGSQVYEE